MEYINIISKESIKSIPAWIALIILGICIVGILAPVIICWIKTKSHDDVFRVVCWSGVIAILFEVITLCICSAFFQVPTGHYKYEATIDKDKISITQYEEFIEKYNPTIKDGVYYWEE